MFAKTTIREWGFSPTDYLQQRRSWNYLIFCFWGSFWNESAKALDWKFHPAAEQEEFSIIKSVFIRVSLKTTLGSVPWMNWQKRFTSTSGFPDKFFKKLLIHWFRTAFVQIEIRNFA
jgi:hypothetical protein